MIKKSTDEKIDELSQMMKKGFEGSDRKINNLAEAMAKGFSNAEISSKSCCLRVWK